MFVFLGLLVFGILGSFGMKYLVEQELEEDYYNLYGDKDEIDIVDNIVRSYENDRDTSILEDTLDYITHLKDYAYLSKMRKKHQKTILYYEELIQRKINLLNKDYKTC